jgi:hypothetical protein
MSIERAMGSESLVVYVNGEYVPKDHARISIFDFGFLRGDAVFDTSSAPDELRGVIVETARRCRLRNAYIQTIVTRGEPPLGH